MKTIVAIYGKNIEEIKKELELIENRNISILELRADYLEDNSTSFIKEIIDRKSVV